jgi:hypothetical protein
VREKPKVKISTFVMQRKNQMGTGEGGENNINRYCDKIENISA